MALPKRKQLCESIFVTLLGIELLTYDSHMLYQQSFPGLHGSAFCEGEQCVCTRHHSIQNPHGIALP